MPSLFALNRATPAVSVICCHLNLMFCNISAAFVYVTIFVLSLFMFAICLLNAHFQNWNYGYHILFSGPQRARPFRGHLSSYAHSSLSMVAVGRDSVAEIAEAKSMVFFSPRGMSRRRLFLTTEVRACDSVLSLALGFRDSDRRRGSEVAGGGGELWTQPQHV